MRLRPALVFLKSPTSTRCTQERPCTKVYRIVNGVVSTEDPGNPGSVVAITGSIHAMEMGVNRPPYKSPLELNEIFTYFTISLLLPCAFSKPVRAILKAI